MQQCLHKSEVYLTGPKSCQSFWLLLWIFLSLKFQKSLNLVTLIPGDYIKEINRASLHRSRIGQKVRSHETQKTKYFQMNRTFDVYLTRGITQIEVTGYKRSREREREREFTNIFLGRSYFGLFNSGLQSVRFLSRFLKKNISLGTAGATP